MVSSYHIESIHFLLIGQTDHLTDILIGQLHHMISTGFKLISVATVCEAFISKVIIRYQRSRTKCQKPETTYQKTETRNQEPETIDRRLGTQNEKPDT